MARLFVRLTPKSAVERVDGWDADEKGRAYLKVRVRAALIEGRANAALIVVLAKELGLPKSRFELVGGETARLKTVDIADVTETELAGALGRPIP